MRLESAVPRVKALTFGLCGVGKKWTREPPRVLVRIRWDALIAGHYVLPRARCDPARLLSHSKSPAVCTAGASEASSRLPYECGISSVYECSRSDARGFSSLIPI